MAHVAPWKKKKIEELTKLIQENSIVGILAVDGVPAPQIQSMRRSLRSHSPFIVCKNNLLKLALKQAASEKENLGALEEILGQTQNALIVSSGNPFKLYNTLKKTESMAPAKGGEIAFEDIVVKGGETPFKPGPIVGDLQKVGIPAAISGGKVIIKKNKVVVKKGESISREVAGALTRLEIFPVKVGLRLKGAYEDGLIFGEDVLSVDPELYLNQLSYGAASAFNLAVNISYTTPLTIRPLLSKAHSEAFNMAFNTGVFTDATMELFVSRAHAQMLSLSSRLSGGLDEELQGMVQNRPPPPTGGGDEKKEDKAEESPEEEEAVSEEDAAAGLGALFG